MKLQFISEKELEKINLIFTLMNELSDFFKRELHLKNDEKI